MINQKFEVLVEVSLDVQSRIKRTPSTLKNLLQKYSPYSYHISFHIDNNISAIFDQQETAKHFQEELVTYVKELQGEMEFIRMIQSTIDYQEYR